MRAQPVIGERCGQGEPRAHRQQCTAPRERAGAPGQQNHASRSSAQRTHDPQRIGERQGVQQEDHAQRPQARADQIHAVKGARARGVRPKGQCERQRRS